MKKRVELIICFYFKVDIAPVKSKELTVTEVKVESECALQKLHCHTMRARK